MRLLASETGFLYIKTTEFQQCLCHLLSSACFARLARQTLGLLRSAPRIRHFILISFRAAVKASPIHTAHLSALRPQLMSSNHCRPHPECKSTPLLNQSCLCVFHGGASLGLDGSARCNTLRFEFLIDAASCKPHPQQLFSVAIRHKEHLTATVQSVAYPAADGRALLTLQLSERSFSTRISCGAWLAVALCIIDPGAVCSVCSLSGTVGTSRFMLSASIGDASFDISTDVPQNIFRGALQLGSRSPDATAQPAIFRSIFADVSLHVCALCRPPPRHGPSSSPEPEPGFSAPLPLRCTPPEFEGGRRR
jgi:hypothetical protein